LSKEVLDLRKRWWYLLPAVFITYSLAYLDRANYGLGAAAGLARSLHITDKQNSLLAALFFLGYFLFQVPGATFARKHSPTRVIFLSLIIWGALASLTGIIHQFWLLAIDRFLLGIAESIVFPAMLFLVTQWFTRSERSRANTVLILGNPLTVLWMSAITGYLIKILGWQKTFVIEGIPAICWAVLWSLIARDRPSKARWITPEAAELLERQLAVEQLTIAPVGAVRKVLLRGDVLLLSFQYFCWSLGVYGFVLWLPSIVRRSGSFSIQVTGLLSAAPYLIAVLLMLLVSHISDRTLKRESLVWPFLFMAGVALLGSFVLADKSFSSAFACLVIAGACMYAPYGPFFAIIPERVPSNVTAEVIAVVNSSGALGAFVGSYLVGLLQAVTGDARASYMLMSISLICSALLMLKLRTTPVATQTQ
jgi:sugar phosphate permease